MNHDYEVLIKMVQGLTTKIWMAWVCTYLMLKKLENRGRDLG